MLIGLQTQAQMSESDFISSTAFRKNICNLPPNPGAEMLRYGWRRPDILSLGQGEGSSITPDIIIDTAHDMMKQGKTFYAPVLGFPEVRTELSNYYQRIYNLDIASDRLFLTGSGTTAMHLALTSILDEGDDVVAITPIWKNLLGAIDIAQAHTTQVPLDQKDGEWSLDLDKLFASVTPKTKAILVVTPSNPCGWVMSPDEIKAVLDFARERDLWIIADEVYGRIVFEGEHAPSFLEYAQPDDKLYVVNSFSKAYAMTGWRLGWLVGPAYAEEVIRDIALYDNMGPASFIQLAGAAALKHGEPFIHEQRQLWKRNLDTLDDFFSQYDTIEFHRPQATFYAFFKHLQEKDCIQFGKRLIDEGGLSLAPGCAFGICSQSFMRLCFAINEEKLDQALQRLAKVLD